MTESIGRHGMYRRWGKRTFDLLVSGTGLVIVLPLLAALSLLVLVVSGRPVFFRQERPGKNGRMFALTKFRTMRPRIPDSPSNDDAGRLTKLGRFLRATSLDELPELWCVLRGDMSMVGPRPLLMEYLPLYTEEQMRRHQVRPGITGLAQVRGRNSLDWTEKFRLDLEYVDNLSLRLDLRILLSTLVQVIFARGVSAEGHVTMPEFLGSTNGREKKQR